MPLASPPGSPPVLRDVVYGVGRIDAYGRVADGVGHLGAWGGVLLCGQVFSVATPLGWILLITIPGVLLPSVLVGIFGVRLRRRALEQLSR